MRVVFALAALLLAALAAAEPLSGVPYISDGDTVEIAGQRIRLLGIDAPETDQACLDAKGADWRCGREARAALVTAFGGRAWRCELRAKNDRYGRRLWQPGSIDPRPAKSRVKIDSGGID